MRQLHETIGICVADRSHSEQCGGAPIGLQDANQLSKDLSPQDTKNLAMGFPYT
jgi:hypothetical protein